MASTIRGGDNPVAYLQDMSSNAQHFMKKKAATIVLQAIGNLRYFGNSGGGVTYSYAIGPLTHVAIGKFLMNGSLYRGVKPVMWSSVEKTALAEAEIEYHDHNSTTIYARFPVKETKIKQIKDNIKVIPKELYRTEYLGTYSSYIGSPMYNGKLQFDLWGVEVSNELFDWNYLRGEIKKYGVRNSLLVAPMPTASTSQILGNYECIEPVISNIYTRRVLAGEFMVINEYLVRDLMLLDKWNETVKNKIIEHDGSVQGIPEIPEFIRTRYKTAWEIKQKHILDLAADRGKFICQSQSLNLFVESPDFKVLSSMHFYGWKRGLKTGMYYLRTRPSSKAIQFTIEPEKACESCSG